MIKKKVLSWMLIGAIVAGEAAAPVAALAKQTSSQADGKSLDIYSEHYEEELTENLYSNNDAENKIEAANTADQTEAEETADQGDASQTEAEEAVEGDASDIIASGSCGESMTWELDESGTLSISGSGEMSDFASNKLPWGEYAESIIKIVIGDGVTNIGAYAFFCLSSLTCVEMADSVVKIGNEVFDSCVNLAEISLSENLLYIGERAFYGTTSLSVITIPDSVTQIDEGAFWNSGLTVLTISENLTNIGARAFDGCAGLADEDGFVIVNKVIYYYCGESSKVIIPDGVAEISESAFFGNKYMVSIEIPDSITTIGEAAFGSCSKLESIVIPDTVTSVGAALFSNCTSLISVTLGSGVTEIPSRLCYLCSHLTTVVMTDNVTSIGNYAFYKCYDLTDINISLSVTSMGREVFLECKSLESIEIPDSVEEVGYWLFYDCESLTSVYIGSGLTQIKGLMFYSCSSLESVEIPKNVTVIDSGAFRECTSLTEITFLGEAPEIGSTAFDKVVATAYYPANDTTWTSDVLQDYGGTITWEGYSIKDVSDAQIVLSSDYYIFDGAAKKPVVTIDYDGTVLSEETDYTVSYTNNIYPGTATVTITGIGDYTGKITLTFEIKLATCSVTYINNTMDGFKVVWNKVEGASGYYIYRRNEDKTYSTTPTATVTDGSTTEWIDPLVLTGGKDYTYKVAAYYEAEDGTITVGSSGTTKTCKYLKGGEVESVTNTTSGLKVTWTKVAGANGYYIFRKAAGEDDYTQVATVTVTSTSTLAWTDTDSLTSGKNYTYKVSAIFTNSKGQVTKGGAKVTKTAKYLAPGKISSLANTSSGIYIKWTKVTGATGYYVYRKASSASSYTLVTTITGVGTVSYTDTAVVNSNNVTYIYYIQPYYKSSVGVITEAGYTTKTVVRLVAPTISSLTNSASKTMTVKWGTKSGVTGYQVQYSANSSFSSGNKTLTVTGASSSSQVISSLTKGKTYYVRVRTYKTVNGTIYYSAWCTVKSVKISK